MLAFGLKVAWFSLSLSGLLGSFAALPTFVQALDGYLLPFLYIFADFVLQALFCLGMIWNLDPFAMPRAFCIVQPALLGISWTSITSVTSCICITTCLTILRPCGAVPASPAYIRGRRRWHPTYFALILFPPAAFTAYLVLTMKFDAVQPVDGMSCDVTSPVWIRLFSYAGVTLLLAVPSFLLTGAAAFQFYTHSPVRHSLSFMRSNDNFTSVPLRRQSKRRPDHPWTEAKSFDEPTSGTYMPDLTPIASAPSADHPSITPSGTVVGEIVPTPPDSLSSVTGRQRVSSGRAPVSPDAKKAGMRYHLPFQWQQSQSHAPSPPTPSPRGSIGPVHKSIDLGSLSSRQTPSPLIFAGPADAQSGNNATHMTTTTTTKVSVTSDPDISEQRIYEAAPWLRDEKALLRHMEGRTPTRAHPHPQTTERGPARARRDRSRAPPPRRGADPMFNDDDDDDEHGDEEDAVSGSLRWIRHSREDSASTVKSELEFARSPVRGEFEIAPQRPSPMNISTYDPSHAQLPIPITLPTSTPTSNVRRLVWRLLLFQFLTATMQILAALSPLVDIFAGHSPPAALGTQHAALLIATWAPVVAFGARPLDLFAMCLGRERGAGSGRGGWR